MAYFLFKAYKDKASVVVEGQFKCIVLIKKHVWLDEVL
jgi:hypothetical protein